MRSASLRTRIAAWYAALVIVVIALGAIAIDFAFRSLLLDQARLRIAQTGDEIALMVDRTAALGFVDVPPIVTLTDRTNLDHWASPTTFIQIDDLGGNALAKSTNMGNLAFAALHGRVPTVHYSIEGAGDGEMLVEDRVITDGSRPIAVAHVGEKLDIIDAITGRARMILVAVALTAAAVVAAATVVIARWAVDPIVRLTAAMEEVGGSSLSRRLRWTGRTDEVGRMAVAFDAMLERLQEAFARERQFISDASHELKTPLTVINANAQMLQRWGERDPAILRESLDAIAAESARLAGIVTGMLTLAKADSGDAIPKEPLPLERVVGDAVRSARDRAAAKGLVLSEHFEGGAIVLGEPSLLRQMAGNLIDNAIKFTEQGRIDVAIRRDNGSAIVEVADTGIGIGDEPSERLFDRFFRGDPSHSRQIEGTGLGLAIVRSIARVHGGTVAARPRPAGGSIFAVTLPAAGTDDHTSLQ